MPVVILVDTNVWVSAFINPHGYPARLKQAWIDGQFQAAVSTALLDELTDVLMRPRIAHKYGITSEEVTEFLRLLAAHGVAVSPTGDLHECRDPDDDLILETAILAGAKYAVSRDDDIKRDLELIEHLQARGVTVLSVQQFADRLDRGKL